MSPEGAAVALAGIEQSAAAVRASSQWVVRSLTAFGVATVFFVPAGGLTGPPWSVLTSIAWGVFLLVMAVSARRRLILRRGFRRLYLTATAIWTVLWVSAALLGLAAFPGRPGYWIPAGLIVAAPMFLAARLARR